jgi:carbamoyl-phosphate synthase large subunit
MTVVITGCGSEGALGLIQSLRDAYNDNIKIIGLDTDAYIGNQIFLDEHMLPPPRDSNDYLDFILTVLNGKKADILWPIPTRELELFALNKHVIEKSTGAKVLIGGYEGISTANNKLKLYKALRGFLPEVVPDFYEVREKNEFEEHIYRLGYPRNKVCIKRTDAAGAVGFRILDPHVRTGDILFYQNPTTTISRWEDIRSMMDDAGTLPEYMVTEYLPGEQWECDTLCYDGKLLNCVTRRNIRMLWGMCAVTHILENNLLYEYCKIIVERLNLSYIINIEFREDSSGQLKILEINPRVNGTVLAPLYAGNNHGKMAIDLLMGNNVIVSKNENDIVLSRYSQVCRIK